MPGLRLGFGVGHKILIKKLNTAKDIWNVNLLALKAGRASLYDENYKKNTLNLIENEKNFLSNELQKYTKYIKGTGIFGQKLRKLPWA